jgi:ankyrin repeat protein
MHSAAGNGHLEIMKLLLERGADIFAMNAEGETLYHLSLRMRRGYQEIADLLRKFGAGRLGEWIDEIVLHGSPKYRQ